MFIRPSLSIFLSITLSTCTLPTWALAQQRPDISGFTHGTPGSDSVVLSLIEGSESPLIGPDHPGSSGNKNGFEGGVAFVQGDSFHLFVTEEPHQWVRTRTGHWTSRDGRQWQRIATIQESADDPQDPRYAIWSPIPVYNEHEGRWDLFYVGYETSGTINGRVFRAVSEKKDRSGLGGPYKDMPGTVLSFEDAEKNDWEGKQGTDSFFPFRVGKKWIALYGSSDAASYWDVGLAEADSLEGRWRRIPGPPILTRAENPIVTRLPDGLYLAVYDDLTDLQHNDRIGYAWSRDGLQWQHAFLSIPMPSWTTNIRTPQSLIPAGKGAYWIYFTGNTSDHFDKIGRIKVSVKTIKP